MKENKKNILAFTAVLFLSFQLAAQSINTNFGKNRVQYHDDFNQWYEYETENFNIYWYGKGRNVAHTVIQLAELDHDNIQQLLEHRINDKIEIIVYLDETDLKQSNIGYEETFLNSTGKTKIVGNKMFVYFDGDHQHLRRQIKEGIASVYINSILIGSNLQEIVQNAILLDLPDWFREGLISYIGSQWDYELDDELRDVFFQDKKYTRFKESSKRFPKITGHSLFFYLDEHYGKSAIANILYLTRINRNLESSFLYVLNQDFETIIEDWSTHYLEHFEKEQSFVNLDGQEEIKLDKKNYVPLSEMLVSPDETMLLYCTNEIGKTKVFLRDLKTGEEEKIFEQGYKNNFQATDYNYPVLCWHPDSRFFSIVFEKKDLMFVRKWNIRTKEYIEQELPENFQRVYTLNVFDDINYLMSANIDGFSDLIMYNTKGRVLKKITDDYYDDLSAVFISDDKRKGVLFSSNRQSEELKRLELDTILPIDNFDIYFLDMSTEDYKLKRLSITDDLSERQPQYIYPDKFSFLSDKSGMLNQYIGSFSDQAYYSCVSNYNRNIIKYSQQGEQHYFMSYYDGSYRVYKSAENWKKEQKAAKTLFYKENFSGEVQIPFLLPEETSITEAPMSWNFQSRFSDPDDIDEIKDNIDATLTPNKELLPESKEVKTKYVLDFVSARAKATRTKFKMDNITLKLDNNVLFEGLESYVGDGRDLQFTPMGLLIKTRTKDLFEDYIFEGGLRVPTAFNGTEFFLTVDNNKRLIDKRYALYRKSETYDFAENLFNGNKIRNRVLLGQYRLKYPFNIYRSIRATATLRQDRQYLLSSDLNSLNAPEFNEKRIGIKLEYVYDNTIDKGINFKEGTRYKIYTEAINRFDLRVIDGFSFDASLGFTTIFGLDARHYINFNDLMVVALRVAGGTSFGSERILYHIGGIESDVLRKYNASIPVPEKAFAFQTPVANLRGFDTNIRNGTSYTLGNAELRLSFGKILGFGSSRWSMLKNLQVIGFYDVGLAWHGRSPYSDENPLNTVKLETPPIVELTIEYFRDPIVMSYGTGLRTTLFGYFVRVDYGWGIETREIQKGRLHLGLGKDF